MNPTMNTKVTVLVSEGTWFVPFAKKLVSNLQKKRIKAHLFFDHEQMPKSDGILFILSYHRLISKQFLIGYKHTVVVHESSLPKGKGWAPLFWQILESKNRIPVVLFEAVDGVDAGPIYLKDTIVLKGDELHDDIRRKQAEKTIEMCMKFIDKHHLLKSMRQKVKSTFYPKRTAADSQLNINLSIKRQFNLLRIVNNEDFPAFFYYKGNKYILRISRESEND